MKYLDQFPNKLLFYQAVQVYPVY